MAFFAILLRLLPFGWSHMLHIICLWIFVLWPQYSPCDTLIWWVKICCS